jgi:fructokinase
MESMRILSFGEILWDIIDGKAHIGGAPFNLAAHLAKLGAECALISAVGSDDLGMRALSTARDLDINTAYIEVYPDRPTGTVDVVLDEKGVPSFTIHEKTAWDRIEMKDDAMERIGATRPDAFCFGTLAQRSAANRDVLRRLLEKVRSNHIFYDVNLRQKFFDKECIETSLTRCTIAKLNDDEAATLSKMLFGRLMAQDTFAAALSAAYDVSIVCITRGANGAAVYSHERFIEAPGVPVAVADTVGAGDAFSAGFLYSLLKGRGAEEAAAFAVKLGGFVASRSGAVPEYSGELLEEIRKI